jgi:hypothetical protein
MASNRIHLVLTTAVASPVAWICPTIEYDAVITYNRYHSSGGLHMASIRIKSSITTAVTTPAKGKGKRKGISRREISSLSLLCFTI